MKRLWVLLQFSVTLFVFAVVARHVDIRASASAESHASAEYLALALVMNLLAVCASTGVWSTFVASNEMRYLRLWRAYIAGLFYNNLGLGTVLGDSFRCTELTRSGHAAPHAIASVLAERLMSAAALLALAAVGSLYFVRSDPEIPIMVCGGVAGAALAACLAYSLLPGVSLRIARRLPKFGVVRRTVASLGDLRRHPWLLARAFVLACAVQACTIGSTFFIARSLSIHLTPAACFAIVPLIALAVLLPISVQGIGVREVMYVTMFGLVGSTREQALSAALLSYTTTIALTAIGAACAGYAMLNASEPRTTQLKRAAIEGAVDLSRTAHRTIARS